MVVAGPTRCEHVVADAAPFKLDLVHAERGDVETAPGEGTGERRRYGRAVALEVFVPRGSDERGLPIVGVEEACFHRQGLAPRRLGPSYRHRTRTVHVTRRQRGAGHATSTDSRLDRPARVLGAIGCDDLHS
jgi:hypothetical protein